MHTYVLYIPHPHADLFFTSLPFIYMRRKVYDEKGWRRGLMGTVLTPGMIKFLSHSVVQIN